MSPPPQPQPVFEPPNEVFTTMRYESQPNSQDDGALVVSKLIPARLRGMLSVGGAQTMNAAATASTNPFLNATDTDVAAATAPTRSTNPSLVDAATPAKHRLYHHIPLLEKHLERLRNSAGAICRAYSAAWSMALLEQERSLEPDHILAAIEKSLSSEADSDATQGHVKGIRVAIRRDGSISVAQRSVTPFPSTLADANGIAARPPSVRFDSVPTRVCAMDLEPVVVNKTDARGFYEVAKQRVGADASVLSGVREADHKCFDVVLWNDEQTVMAGAQSTLTSPARLVTETSVANVLVEHIATGGGKSPFVTPRTSTGILDGLLRHWMVDKGLVEEADVELDELVRQVRDGTAHIWLCNSLRGVWKVDMADPPR